ncbi:hypothetical protein TPHA_0C02800 [Tetrapisispora phaffii CBS 4417]|uniref:RNA polymerase II subunit B1 CTD phosphatase RPAP2 homolog n=1 Tax=Tetrapisispora phaffii (strain ATCC 24235 / CBS 4417 / NBRC 1672 / NRRL Y-8282 / UCD 70-5) TaxID=1071381 RepID=G8BRQ7_TETPH|nr:hypothetical protein TPHA_0C02800 [Tetrapisispora phaffii CBS 4417]CCE62433.1 hypothetical protein TPHA_0C02800 [Tetrapisispora phaffii CBS 4417]
MISKENIQENVLKSHQKHRQLSMKESESISVELLELLCDSCCKDEDSLKYLSRLLTPELYNDLIDERNLNKKCGYPLCDKSPERIRDPFSINYVTKKFLWENNPYAYLSTYCSKFHFKCSQFYMTQLSEDALFARTGVHLYSPVTKLSSEVGDSNNLDDKYTVTLFEEIVRNKSSDEDIKKLISNLKKLGIHNADDSQDEVESDISKWISDIKIIENNDPSELGDLIKE